MRRDACAAIVCLPRSKRCRIPAKQRKREASIDLNRWAASGAGHFHKTRDDSARDVVETLRACGVFAESRHRLAGVPPDTNARIDFNLAKHGHAVSQRGFRAFTMSKNVHRLAAVRAGKCAYRSWPPAAASRPA